MDSKMDKVKEIFVLGAGFSKAFFEDAHLLFMERKKFDENEIEKHKYAYKIYKLALDKNDNVNVEKLMTRLSGRMPYDYNLDEKTQLELDWLLTYISSIYIKNLNNAKEGKIHKEELEKFAKYCIDNGTNCITFNHDDYLDEALWRVSADSNKCWHPDYGYGFFCRSSESLLRAWSFGPNDIPMSLLKLHGSINWRIKKGYLCQYKTVDSIVHHENWIKFPGQIILEDYLEEEPFFIPPVLDKSEFADEPVLRMVWSRAFKELSGANKIKFIGYSFPNTDSIIESLFRESIKEDTKIEVISYQEDEDSKDKENLINRYKSIFPKMNEEDFHFEGAREWSTHLK